MKKPSVTFGNHENSRADDRSERSLWLAKLCSRPPPSALKPLFSAIPSSSVLFPDPFSQTKKVTSEVILMSIPCENAGILKGYRSRSTFCGEIAMRRKKGPVRLADVRLEDTALTWHQSLLF